jgi:hypothetical protein
MLSRDHVTAIIATWSTCKAATLQEAYRLAPGEVKSRPTSPYSLRASLQSSFGIVVIPPLGSRKSSMKEKVTSVVCIVSSELHGSVNGGHLLAQRILPLVQLKATPNVTATMHFT